MLCCEVCCPCHHRTLQPCGAGSGTLCKNNSHNYFVSINPLIDIYSWTGAARSKKKKSLSVVTSPKQVWENEIHKPIIQFPLFQMAWFSKTTACTVSIKLRGKLVYWCQVQTVATWCSAHSQCRFLNYSHAENSLQGLTKPLWPSNELIHQALIVSVSRLTQFE